MSGIATFKVIGISSKELLREFLHAICQRRNAEFKAIRLDDPNLTPNIHTFSVHIEKVHNESNQSPAFDVTTNESEEQLWFRIEITDNKPVHFDLIL